jgi:hypothetical protein
MQSVTTGTSEPLDDELELLLELGTLDDELLELELDELLLLELDELLELELLLLELDDDDDDDDELDDDELELLELDDELLLLLEGVTQHPHSPLGPCLLGIINQVVDQDQVLDQMGHNKVLV